MVVNQEISKELVKKCLKFVRYQQHQNQGVISGQVHHFISKTELQSCIYSMYRCTLNNVQYDSVMIGYEMVEVVVSGTSGK